LQEGSEVNGGRGFADASLVVGNSDEAHRGTCAVRNFNISYTQKYGDIKL
jgi:hypothetical protein